MRQDTRRHGPFRGTRAWPATRSTRWRTRPRRARRPGQRHVSRSRRTTAPCGTWPSRPTVWGHGTKFALEALSDCLRLEAKPFGIDFVVIEPGGIATEWGAIAADKLEKFSTDGAYAARAAAVASSLRSETNAKRNSPPSVSADVIGKAVTTRHPKTRYATGFGARPLIALRRILPDRAFDSVISRAVGLPR
ncbi:hypothetical protein [Streptomyces aureus]|uniref:hypothetical protein n=1 Tax=Streptomyces aureus TaxID=193461 RepID=UPI0036B1A0B2